MKIILVVSTSKTRVLKIFNLHMVHPPLPPGYRAGWPQATMALAVQPRARNHGLGGGHWDPIWEPILDPILVSFSSSRGLASRKCELKEKQCKTCEILTFLNLWSTPQRMFIVKTNEDMIKLINYSSSPAAWQFWWWLLEAPDWSGMSLQLLSSQGGHHNSIISCLSWISAPRWTIALIRSWLLWTSWTGNNYHHKYQFQIVKAKYLLLFDIEIFWINKYCIMQILFIKSKW